MSSLPAFLDALQPRLAARLAGVQVVDGPPLAYVQADVVALGITTEDNTVDSSVDGAGLRARREQVDVVNLIRSWSGDPNLAARRNRAFELLDAVDAELRADPTVGGSCARARLAGHTYSAARDEKGTGCFVEFRVRVDAFPS